MYYKPDWAQAKKRILSYWNNEDTDRCCVAVTAPRKSSPYKSYAELQKVLDASLGALNEEDQEGIRCWWTDPEQNYARMVNWFENTYFGGEAIPCTFVNWGAMALAAFYGSRPDFRKETVWYHPAIEDLESWQWQFDECQNLYWRQTMDIMNLLVERCDGRYFIGTPEFGTAGDLLSLIRGMERFALDLVEYPEASIKAIEVLGKAWVRLHEQVYQITQPHNDGGGTLAWMLLWAPGRISQLHAISLLISPRMYKEFFVPKLRLKATGAGTGYTT